MDTNIRCLIKACKIEGLKYEQFHSTQNLVLVDKKHLFVNWSTPLISHSVYRLLVDKDYLYTLLNGYIDMPLTKAYLAPSNDPRFSKYKSYNNISEIVSDIENNFSYPIIIKKNQGSLGCNVFLVKRTQDTEAALSTIFNEQSKDWDFVALAQEYIERVAEYRIITLNGKVELVYLKDTTNATYCGNLSPLHWNGGKAVKICDEKLIQKLSDFIAPIFSRLPISFCGIDIIQNKTGDLRLIEINGSPGFEHFCNDNGDEDIVKLYQKILHCLTNG